MGIGGPNGVNSTHPDTCYCVLGYKASEEETGGPWSSNFCKTIELLKTFCYDC